MSNVFDELKERGFIEQCTDEEEIKKVLGEEKVTFYIGFDPTADSLHVGHYLQIMAMTHMQRHGHIPIALIGGGTTMVGDPTNKDDMRKIMSQEEINNNANKFKKTFQKLIDFEDNKAMMINNADWLLDINYVDFLRDVGVHFSVNKMLGAEAYKSRMERGLTFLEFNYMLMQSYDFYILYKKYNCKMQFGGNDQWSNIIGGTELIRKKTGGQAYGMTFSLLTTSEGKKMGKTEKGALWLDAEKTSPYEFYQYWRNIDDADVYQCLSLLTFLPMEEVKELSALEGAEINRAKEVLAYEVTKNIHSEEEARKVQDSARSIFGAKTSRNTDMPSTEVEKDQIKEGQELLNIMQTAGLISSKSEGRRLVQQGGVSVNDKKIADVKHQITLGDFTDNELIIRKGKKVYHKIKLI